MSRRTLVSSALSVVLGILLAGLLIKFARIDLSATGRMIAELRRDSLAEITLLLALNGFLAAEKWRLIDRCLGQGNTPPMPRLLYFAFTSIGVGLGQIVPAQLSLLLCRSIGAHLHGGRGLLRGTTATLLDQSFDLLVAMAVALASGLVLLGGGGGRAWLITVAIFGVAGWLAYPFAMRGVGRFLNWANFRYPRTAGWTGTLTEPLLRPAVGQRLWALSAARFFILVLIGVASAKAAATDLPAWHIAASLPFAVIGNVLAITPGGLGVNEWAVSSALVAFGASFQSAAQWAIVNRVYVALAAAIGGVAGAAIAACMRPRRAVTPA